MEGDRKGLVYLIQGGDYFKIGRTSNLINRLKVIQTNHAWTLKVLQTWETPDSVLLERYLHRRFSGVKMHGEWFALSQGDVLLLQATHEWPLDVLRPRQKRSGLSKTSVNRQLIDLPSPTAKLLRKHGLTQRDLTRALQQHKPPISRSFAHYLWHGVKPLSANAAIAIHQAYPDLISQQEIFEVLESSRRNPDMN